jgi:hypothetical protein
MDAYADTNSVEWDAGKQHGDEPVELTAEQLGRVGGGAEGLATAYPD